MIKIMERDKNFLTALNEAGASNTHTLFRFYPENYGRERIGRWKMKS